MSYPEMSEMGVLRDGLCRVSVEPFERYEDRNPSGTDASAIAVCEAHGVDHIASFDGFDGLGERVGPA